MRFATVWVSILARKIDSRIPDRLLLPDPVKEPTAEPNGRDFNEPVHGFSRKYCHKQGNDECHSGRSFVAKDIVANHISDSLNAEGVDDN